MLLVAVMHSLIGTVKIIASILIQLFVLWVQVKTKHLINISNKCVSCNVDHKMTFVKIKTNTKIKTVHMTDGKYTTIKWYEPCYIYIFSKLILQIKIKKILEISFCFFTWKEWLIDCLFFFYPHLANMSCIFRTRINNK